MEHQLEWVTCPPDEGIEVSPKTEHNKAIQIKLVAYTHQNKAKGHQGFNRSIHYVFLNPRKTFSIDHYPVYSDTAWPDQMGV